MQAIDASENVDFNLHTHVECNSPLLPDPKTIVISTHVECDEWNDEKCMLMHISTHVECDPSLETTTDSSYPISTHALTWSATNRTDSDTRNNGFQLTHSRGVRL